MTVAQLAKELGANERSLRRAVNDGLVRAARPSPRKLTVSVAERAYLRRSAPFLFRLREMLRTEPGVELVVLFGSRARGDHDDHSDVDLLVAARGSRNVRDLADRLSRRLGLRVEVVTLDDAATNPRLLAEVLRDGRVLIDRGRQWPRLKRRDRSVTRAAERESDEIRARFDATFLK